MYRSATPTRTISIVLLSALCACSAGKSKKELKSERKLAKQEAQNAAAGRSTPGAATGDLSKFAATGCDATLWNHVYNPARLQQLSPCVSATGIVQESTVDDDGDQHFLLVLDPGQDALVNERNQKKKTGALVVEIVCANPALLKKARASCANYRNSIAKPVIGSHVRATGTLVIDSHNGWAEIHPVSKLQGM
jgi:hypothetical protein